jgi:hypothetical protein
VQLQQLAVLAVLVQQARSQGHLLLMAVVVVVVPLVVLLELVVLVAAVLEQILQLLAFLAQRIRAAVAVALATTQLS